MQMLLGPSSSVVLQKGASLLLICPSNFRKTTRTSALTFYLILHLQLWTAFATDQIRCEQSQTFRWWSYLVLRLSMALCELSESAEVSLKTSQLGSRGRTGLSVTAASSLPQTGPQGQQKVTEQELHPLRGEKRQRSKCCLVYVHKRHVWKEKRLSIS